MKQKLAIDSYKEKIVRTVLNNQVTIIQGGTGIGKSTKIPQYLAECGYRVLITQPRRLAAISLATRVSNEMNDSEVGTLVGYNTGIEKCYSLEDSKIIFLTDGLELLLQMFGKERLDNTVLIIDEIHEWSINIDILLAWSKKQLESGFNFKLVLMSATLDANKLSTFFPDSIFIQIPNKTYPVSFEHRKASEIENSVLELVKENRNVLVFLPGKLEIRNLNTKLQALFKSFHVTSEIMELHGDLEYYEQQKIFKRFSIPKVILSTNIAQTSITIADIDAVVDTGLEKQSEVHEGIQGLFLKNISKADCIQRKGRAGRCKPGRYILCSDYPYNKRLYQPTPEIYLNSLSEWILKLSSIGLDLNDLDFVHQPDLVMITESKELLRLLGAFDENNNITPLGMEMANIPLSVRYSRMLIEAKKYNVEADMLIIVLILQNGSILKKEHVRSSINDFASQSDLFYELEVFRSIYTNDFDVSILDSMNDIDTNHFKLLLEQLDKISFLMDIDITKENKDPISLKKCILSGLTDNLFIYTSKFYYKDLLETHRVITRNSIFYKRFPTYVVGIPINISYFDSNNKKFLTLLSQCTVFSLEELLEYFPTLFDVRYSFSKDIICKDLYYNNIQIKSEELGSVEYLRQIDPDNFRNEVKEIPKFHQTYCYTYYHNLVVSAKQI